MVSPAQRKQRLAELLVTAAGALTAPPEQIRATPRGTTVLRGRLALTAEEVAATTREPVMVTAPEWFAWVGPAGEQPPFSVVTQTERARVDERDRLCLPFRSRDLLIVRNAARFNVLPVLWGGGGVLLVPTEDFWRRFEGVRDVLA